MDLGEFQNDNLIDAYPVGGSRDRESPGKDCRCTQRVTPSVDQSFMRDEFKVCFGFFFSMPEY